MDANREAAIDRGPVLRSAALLVLVALVSGTTGWTLGVAFTAPASDASPDAGSEAVASETLESAPVLGAVPTTRSVSATTGRPRDAASGFGNVADRSLSKGADAVLAAGEVVAPFIPGGSVLTAAIAGVRQLKSSEEQNAEQN